MNGMVPDLVRALAPAIATFAIGIALTPILTHYLYQYRAWKKIPGKIALDGSAAAEFNRLHEGNEIRAPRMGGIVIWGSVLLVTAGTALLALFFPSFAPLDFLSRNQTWIPFATLIIGALAGLADDLRVISKDGSGVPLSIRLAMVIVLSIFIGWWFYAKLEVTSVNIPFAEPLYIGWLIIPLFVITSLALYASGVIDGIDGLSGGVFGTVFASYAIIAFIQQQIDLAAFTAAVVGGILAFLWFNVPPARFYMSDTGTMALTLTLAVIAFMTDNLGGGFGIFVLPLTGGLLAATVLSDIMQILSKRFWGRKLFRVAPLHHHFEAVGWPGYKVVMRYWILSVVCAFFAVTLSIAAL